MDIDLQYILINDKLTSTQRWQSTVKSASKSTSVINRQRMTFPQGRAMKEISHIE
jgi:hypothetical protein